MTSDMQTVLIRRPKVWSLELTRDCYFERLEQRVAMPKSANRRYRLVPQVGDTRVIATDEELIDDDVVCISYLHYSQKHGLTQSCVVFHDQMPKNRHRPPYSSELIIDKRRTAAHANPVEYFGVILENQTMRGITMQLSMTHPYVTSRMPGLSSDWYCVEMFWEFGNWLFPTTLWKASNDTFLNYDTACGASVRYTEKHRLFRSPSVVLGKTVPNEIRAEMVAEVNGDYVSRREPIVELIVVSKYRDDHNIIREARAALPFVKGAVKELLPPCCEVSVGNASGVWSVESVLQGPGQIIYRPFNSANRHKRQIVELHTLKERCIVMHIVAPRHCVEEVVPSLQKHFASYVDQLETLVLRAPTEHRFVVVSNFESVVNVAAPDDSSDTVRAKAFTVEFSTKPILDSWRWPTKHNEILDIAIVFLGHELPAYCVLWIIDWLPDMHLERHSDKIRLIEAVRDSIYRVAGRRDFRQRLRPRKENNTEKD